MRSVNQTAALSSLAFATLCLGQPSGDERVLPGGTSDFVIVETEVRASANYLAQVRVLGSEISYGGEYAMPVTLQVQMGETTLEPFGDSRDASLANLNTGERGQTYELTEKAAASGSFSLQATSWKRDSDDHATYMTVGTDSNSSNVLVLRNGDSVPDIAPLRDQESIGNLVKDFVDPDTGKVVLWDDEVIFLFELGTTNLTSSAADFQDLVVLVTFADEASRFDRVRIPPLHIGD